MRTFRVSKMQPLRQFPTPEIVPQTISWMNVKLIGGEYYFQFTQKGITNKFKCYYLQMLNKTITLSTLKQTNYQLQLSTEHVLAIILDNRVTIPEARKYLNHQYNNNEIEWRTLSQSEFENIAHQCEKYVEEERESWMRAESEHPKNRQSAQQIKKDLLPKLDIKDPDSNRGLLEKLKNKEQFRIQMMSIHMNTESQAIIREQNQQLQQLILLLQSMIQYEEELDIFTKSSDSAYHQLITQILRQKDKKTSLQEQSQRQREQKAVEAKMEEYDRKLLLLKKRLYQIFLFYCRQNNTKGQTFQKYNSNSQMLDLRLFLKYFKDYQYIEANKYRFKVTKVTLLFRNTAVNGLSMNFQQFWQVHKQMFELGDLNLTRMNIIEANLQKLPILQKKWQEQVDKLKELNDIVSEEKTKDIFKFSNLKIESTPQQSLKKNKSSVVISTNLSSKPASKQSTPYVSRYQQQTQSERDLFKPLKRNFIQQIRQEIMNIEESAPRKNIYKTGSQYSLSPEGKTGKFDLNLPKILKLSNQEISSQGIYKSLKHFSKLDYTAQSQKIRDIIGFSTGQDDDIMNMYFVKQELKAEKMKRQLTIDRQIKRKEFLESVTKRGHRCRKLKVDQIEPYMRF